MNTNDAITDTQSGVPNFNWSQLCFLSSLNEMHLYVKCYFGGFSESPLMMIFDVAKFQYLETITSEDYYNRRIGKTLNDRVSSSGSDIVYTKEDEFILVSSHQGYEMWSIQSGEQVFMLDISYSWMTCDDYGFTQWVVGADEKYIFAQGMIFDDDTGDSIETIDIFDLKTGEYVGCISGFYGIVNLIPLSDNKLIVITDANGIAICDVVSQECIKRIEVAGASSDTITTKDEKYLVNVYSIDQKNEPKTTYIEFLDINSGQCTKAFSIAGENMNFAVPSDDKFIFLIQSDCIKKWDTETCEIINEIKLGSIEYNNFIVSSDDKFIFLMQSDCIKKINTETFEVVGEVNCPLIK